MLAVYEQEAQRRNAEHRGAHRRRAESPRRVGDVDRRDARSRVRAARGPAHAGAARRRRALASRLPRRVRDDPRRCGRSVDRGCSRRSPMPIRSSTRGRSTRSPGSSSRRSCGAARSTGRRARAHVLRFCLPGARDSAVAMDLPPNDAEYFDAEYETMPRPQLESLQEELLLEMLPYAYEHAAVIRQAWDDAGRAPARHHESLADFRERAPFVDKHALRRFRDERGDPYGGLCARPADELTARDVDVGHDRRPDTRAREVGRRRWPAVDHHAATSGAWACDPAITSRSCCSRTAGRRTGCSRASARCPSSSTSTRPRWTGSAISRSATDRPVSTTSGRCSSMRCAKCASGATSIPPTCSPPTRASCSRASR